MMNGQNNVEININQEKIPIISCKCFCCIVVGFMGINLLACILAKNFYSGEFVELVKLLLIFDVLTLVLVKMLIKYVRKQ